jgi:uncharacterized protein
MDKFIAHFMFDLWIKICIIKITSLHVCSRWNHALDETMIQKIAIIKPESNKNCAAMGGRLSWRSTLAALMLSAAIGCSNPPVRVLILTGANNHSWQPTTAELVKLYRTSGFAVCDTVLNPASLAARLAGYEVLVSNWNAWPQVTGRQWGAASEQAFLHFMQQGGGLVLLHAASATLQDWPDFQRMAGATWKLEQTGHGRIHPFQVVMADSLHPITQGLKPFTITDELWHRMELQPDAHILCRAFSALENKGSGQWEPVALVTRFGKGRCFYSVLGHDAQAMSSLGWRRLMLRGTEWAATGKVTFTR